MNGTDEPSNDDLRYAEYVLGVLDAPARAAIEHELSAGEARARAAIDLWQRHLTPLSEDLPGLAPPAYVWHRIEAALGFAANLAPSQAPAPTRRGAWDNLPLWRWLGLGGGLLAAACLALLLLRPLPPSTPTTPAPAIEYMVASIAQDNGVAGWTATMDLAHARMVIVPATPEQIAAGRSPELWLIPPGEKPISLGVIARDKPTTVALRPALLARLSAQAALAVSLEPGGGSPSGQPTGPILGKGAISGA